LQINKPCGITQDSKTRNYMLVLNSKCKKCCNICYSIYFQQQFINWTSDNNDIDKFIQDSQLSAHKYYGNALEWIPYNRLYDIKYVSKDEFGKVYRANWIDGYLTKWDNENKNWKRNSINMFVNLKYLNTPYNLTLEFTNKV
jgi:hypothetical protein